jgi:hypothetical protein
MLRIACAIAVAAVALELRRLHHLRRFQRQSQPTLVLSFPFITGMAVTTDTAGMAITTDTTGVAIITVIATTGMGIIAIGDTRLRCCASDVNGDDIWRRGAAGRGRTTVSDLRA